MSIQAAQANNLPTCPSCGKRGLRIIEHSKEKISVRRRKKCDFCGYMETTQEVSQDFFARAKENAAIVYNLTKVLYSHAVEELEKPTTAVATKLPEIPCDTCGLMGSNGCSFGIPEAETEQAIGCNLYAERYAERKEQSEFEE
jgi:hypothetical protein